MAIVVTVREYGGTPEEAKEAMTEVESRYEGAHFVYAASSLDDLPHPTQVASQMPEDDSLYWQSIS